MGSNTPQQMIVIGQRKIKPPQTYIPEELEYLNVILTKSYQKQISQ